jgi:POT family proton-dependent oligopeptide transporter
VFLSLHLIDLCINIGSLSPILTTSLESSVGFYAAYFLCFAMFIIGLITLIYGKNNYIIKRPTGSPVFDALRIIWIRVRTGTFEAAKSGGGRGKAGRPWSDRFVEELKKALEACRVFVSRRRRPSSVTMRRSFVARFCLR